MIDILIDLLYVSSKLVLALAAFLVLLRAWRAPSIFDRVLAVDTLALAVVGYLLLEAYGPMGRFYTDAALGLALFSFVTTALLAYFLQNGEYPDE